MTPGHHEPHSPPDYKMFYTCCLQLSSLHNQRTKVEVEYDTLLKAGRRVYLEMKKKDADNV